MEEANVSKRHSDAVLVAGINNMIVTDTTACFCYVFNTTLMSTLNIVASVLLNVRASHFFLCFAF